MNDKISKGGGPNTNSSLRATASSEFNMARRRSKSDHKDKSSVCFDEIDNKIALKNDSLKYIIIFYI